MIGPIVYLLFGLFFAVWFLYDCIKDDDNKVPTLGQVCGAIFILFGWCPLFVTAFILKLMGVLPGRVTER